jgi:hypothetical protein
MDKINYENKYIPGQSYYTDYKSKSQFEFEKDIENPKNNFEYLRDL